MLLPKILNLRKQIVYLIHICVYVYKLIACNVYSERDITKAEIFNF